MCLDLLVARKQSFGVLQTTLYLVNLYPDLLTNDEQQYKYNKAIYKFDAQQKNKWCILIGAHMLINEKQMNKTTKEKAKQNEENL